MWTLGIDVAKRSHRATLLDQDGQAVFRNLAVEHSREGVELLCKRLAETGRPSEDIRVGMEAAGHYWMVLYEALVQAGHAVEVINPLVVAARRNITIRGTKTDSADALLIAHLLRETDLKVCAIPDRQVQPLRDLTRLRYQCAQTAKAEKGHLVSLLDLAVPEYRQHFADLFGAASRAVLAEFPTADELARVDIRRLTRLMKEASRGAFGRHQARALKAAAKDSFALTHRSQHLALEIRFVMERVNLLIDQIAQLDKRLRAFMTEQQTLPAVHSRSWTRLGTDHPGRGLAGVSSRGSAWRWQVRRHRRHRRQAVRQRRPDRPGEDVQARQSLPAHRRHAGL